MRKPASMWSLETLGRQRLSPYFFMREFMYSEIANFHGIQNIPDNPDLALDGGRKFCETILDPLVETFGTVSIRSGYRSPGVNKFGNDNKLNCAHNDNPMEMHIWDHHQGDAQIAGATVVLPWFADRYDGGRDWRDLAWWLHDHLTYSDLWFFPKLCAFNIAWRAVPRCTISSYMAPRGMLLRDACEPVEPIDQRRDRYSDFPSFRGLALPV
ncbi:MAG: hypothetical protein ACPGRD_00585 [Planktomarina sp.]